MSIPTATPGADASSSRASRGRRLRLARIALCALVTLAVVGTIPPLRHAATVVASRAALIVLSPLAPDLEDFDELAQGSRILAADGSELADLGTAISRHRVRLAELPDHVTKAVLAAEDANFNEHGGVDPSAVFRALVRDAAGGRQGGSTITQQLAKLNYTNSERTFLRKLREVQYAVRLEKKYSKDELLERYLDQVYFGDGAYGLTAAAKRFFATEPERLTPAQAATLAGKIKAPEALDPATAPDKVRARRDHVLRSMQRRGWLDPAAARSAIATPLKVAPPTESTGPAPYFVEYVRREAAKIDELGGTPDSRAKRLFTGGYTVETTADPKAIQAATRAVQGALPDAEDPEAAVVGVVPGDGAIRVLVGGRDYQRRNFDLASQGRRQPGSSFKPYVYLAALGEGIDPRSTFDATSPKELEYRGERYTVDNYEGEGRGRSDLDDAMTHSVNTVFAQLVLKVGPENVTRTGAMLGIHDVDENVGSRPAIGLGGLRTGVTPLEQAAAYATFAAKGVYAEPYAITEIRDRRGRTVFKRRPATKQVFPADEVGVLNAALVDVVQQGTGRAARIGRPVAGKTGTTQEHGDAWFVGFVPQLATAVWVGHPDGVEPMTDVHGRRVTGGSYPAEIWAAAMRDALDGLPVQQLFTASPDRLDLRRLDPTASRGAGGPGSGSTAPSSSTSSSSSTTTTLASDTSTSTSTTSVPGQLPTTTTTTAPGTTTTSTTAATTTTTSTTTSSTTSSTTTTTVAAPP